jgi:hypothetical protein
MYCPACGAWNPDESKFCGRCGKPIPRGELKSGSGGFSCLPVAIALVLILIAVAGVGGFLMRDRLLSAWRGLTAAPTPALPTATEALSPTQVAVLATATAVPSPSPTAVPTATVLPTPTTPPTETPTPTPRPRTFKLVYRDCIPHGLGLGSVKGQVFGTGGTVIPGARVRITINGFAWQSEANPASTNGEGWYEWILDVDQKVQFVELIVDGESVPFSPQGFEVVATAGCFQRVDFVEQ